MQVTVYLCIVYIHTFDETVVTWNYHYYLFSLFLYYCCCIRIRCPFVISVPYGLNNNQLFLNNNHAFSSSIHLMHFLYSVFSLENSFFSFQFPPLSTAVWAGGFSHSGQFCVHNDFVNWVAAFSNARFAFLHGQVIDTRTWVQRFMYCNCFLFN